MKNTTVTWIVPASVSFYIRTKIICRHAIYDYMELPRKMYETLLKDLFHHVRGEGDSPVYVPDRSSFLP